MFSAVMCEVEMQSSQVCHSAQDSGMSYCPTPTIREREAQEKARKHWPSTVLEKQLNRSQAPSEEEPPGTADRVGSLIQCCQISPGLLGHCV